MRTLQLRHFIELNCDAPSCAVRQLVIGFTMVECERKVSKLGWFMTPNWTFCLCPACTALCELPSTATHVQPHSTTAS